MTGLLIVTPGGLESYFAELHAALRSNADPAEVKRIQDAYGTCGPDCQRASASASAPHCDGPAIMCRRDERGAATKQVIALAGPADCQIG